MLRPRQIPQLQDGYTQEVITELDLKDFGIATILWATGYTFDFSLVKLPVVDADGYPIQKRGVTEYEDCSFSECPGYTAEDREFCSALEMMPPIWQRILWRVRKSTLQ